MTPDRDDTAMHKNHPLWPAFDRWYTSMYGRPVADNRGHPRWSDWGVLWDAFVVGACHQAFQDGLRAGELLGVTPDAVR